MVSDRGETATFRPSLAVYEDSVGKPLVRGALVGGVLVVVVGVIEPIWLVAGSVVTVALVTAALASLISLAYTRWGRVNVGAERVSAIGFFGRRRHCARDAIGSTVRVGTEFGGRYAVGSLFVLRRDGHRVLRLTTGFWPADQLDALVAAIKAPEHVKIDSADIDDLIYRFPHAFSWYRRHLVWTTVIAVASVFLLIAAAAAVIIVATE